ncbi:MAG: Gfo/Idh/MocA family oxidoreductase [Bdellovibrionales bacterium]|nr:Gfo/Idh/MocA family oxidoreductase [Bdellovibrionales bacterium]
MKKFEIALLGTGRINQLHCKILKKSKFFRPYIASRSKEKSKDFQKKFSLDASFSSYESAIESSCPGILIGTPPKSHLNLIKKCIENQKTIFIEKPILYSFDESQELIKLIENYPQEKLFVLENQSFDSLHKKICTLPSKYSFGKLYQVKLHRLGKVKVHGWRSQNQEMPYGALHEAGVHWIRRMQELVESFNGPSKWSDVHAHTPSFLPHCPGEDTIDAYISFSKHVQAQLFHTWRYTNEFPFCFSSIYCENGSVHFEGKGSIGFFRIGNKRKWILPNFFDFGGYKLMWKHIENSLSKKIPFEPSIDKILDDFLLIEKIYDCLDT